MAVGDKTYYKFLKICIIVILSQRIWGTCMSRMNFEHAYSGQNTSGGVGPHMDLSILVLWKNYSSTSRSDGYTSSLILT